MSLQEKSHEKDKAVLLNTFKVPTVISRQQAGQVYFFSFDYVSMDYDSDRLKSIFKDVIPYINEGKTRNLRVADGSPWQELQAFHPE